MTEPLSPETNTSVINLGGTTVNTPQNFVQDTPTESDPALDPSFDDNYRAFTESQPGIDEYDPDSFADPNFIEESDDPPPPPEDEVLIINQESIVLDLERPIFRSDGAGGQIADLWASFDDVSGAVSYSFQIVEVNGGDSLT